MFTAKSPLLGKSHPIEYRMTELSKSGYSSHPQNTNNTLTALLMINTEIKHTKLSLEIERLEEKIQEQRDDLKSKKSVFSRLFCDNTSVRDIEQTTRKLHKTEDTLYSQSSCNEKKRLLTYIAHNKQASNNLTKQVSESLDAIETIKKHKKITLTKFELECKAIHARKEKASTMEKQYKEELSKIKTHKLHADVPFIIQDLVEQVPTKIDEIYLQQKLALLFLQLTIELLEKKNEIRMEYNILEPYEDARQLLRSKNFVRIIKHNLSQINEKNEIVKLEYDDYGADIEDTRSIRAEMKK